MAISASTVTATQTLEEFRQEYNKLQNDVLILKDNPTYGTSIVFEGATADAYETTLTVVDPTADRTISIPNADGTLLVTGQASFQIQDGGTIGSVSDMDSMTIAASGVITFSQNPIMSAGITVADAGTVGSASATSAITIASTGIVTFADDIITKDDGTIGSSSAPTAMTIDSSGIVAFVDDIKIKDGGTIGSATDIDAITIASAGAVTFSQRDVHTLGITVADAGEIGSASDTDAIAISAAGVVAFSATTEASATNTAAVTVAGGLGVEKDVWIGDDLTLDSDAAILSFGESQDVTLTHVASTGLLLNSTMAIQFNDATQYINAPDATTLDINATDEIELNATLVDINANLDVSGTLVVGGTLSAVTSITVGSAALTEAELEFLDGITAGTAAASKTVVPDSSGDVTIADSDEWKWGTGDDMKLYHDGTDSYITNAQGELKIATQTSGIAVKIGHATSEVTINDNLTVSGNLTVTGTQTVVDTVTMNAANAIILEGATADDFETTLTLVDPTADRTITFPNETGTVHTSGGNITIPDAGTIGSATDSDSIDISSGGVVNFSQRPTFAASLTVQNDGQIGSTGDTDAIAISSAGVVAISTNTDSTSASTGAITAHSAGFADDVYIGDHLNVGGAIHLSNATPAELRWYEGANYVGLKAPLLGANQIWALPTADGNSGEAIVTDSSGNLSFATNNIGNASTFTIIANNSTNETVYPIFADAATGEKGAETDTALNYNPSTGLLSTAGVTTTGDINVGGALTVTGTTTLNGALVLGDAAADTLTIGATVAGASPLVFEGATANDFETTFAITDPTADRIVTFADETGTVHTSGGTTTHTGIVIADAGNIGSASDTNAITISSGGVVAVTATTASTTSTDGAFTVAGGAGIAADLSVGDDIFMVSDGAQISWGADSDGNAVLGIDEADAIVLETGGTDGAGTHAGYGIVLNGTDGSSTNADSAILYQHQDIRITSPEYHPLVRKGEGTFITLNSHEVDGVGSIVLDGTDGSSTDAGDNILLDNDGGGVAGGELLHEGSESLIENVRLVDETDGDNIIGEDEVFLHSGMQRNVINIIGSDGKIKNSIAGFAPGAI